MGAPEPLLPPWARKTYSLVADRSKPIPQVQINCEEANCEHWREGWVTTLDLATEQGRGFHTLATGSGRQFEERRQGTMAYLHFFPGQPCFRATKHFALADERPALYLIRNGDERQYTSRTLVPRAADWVDDFRGHAETLSDEIKKG